MAVIWKGVTVRQPHADLLANGDKHYETKSKPTRYRGPVLIHAGKNPKGAIALLAQMAAAKVTMRCDVFRPGTFVHEVVEALFPCPPYYLSDKTPTLNVFEFGTIIAYAEIVGCYPVEDIKNLSERERLFGDWTPGRYAWEIAHVRRVQPLPYRGQLGLWNVPSDVMRSLIEIEAVQS